MKRGWRGMLGVVLVGFAAGCDDVAPTASEEVAGELRALRLLLAQQARAVPAAANGERPDVQAALAPLRSALDALAQSQRELAERQVALTQEMQRWSLLLVESVQGARADEAKATAAKLKELETSLRTQDVRHREVETVIQGALERTADQLDEFLRRLQGTPGTAAPPAKPAGGGGAAPAVVPAVGERNGEQALLDDSRPASRSSRASMRWWWLGLTCVGAVVATFCLRRARRPAAFAVRSEPVAEPVTATPPLAKEQSVEEIWAAAALLGEAVGRLRQTAAGEGLPAPTREATLVEPGLDDEFVLVDDEVAVAKAPAAPVVLTPAPRAPETMLARVAGVGSEPQVLAALAEERLVLRRPAPSCRVREGTLEVSFHVLPGTTAGERARLLQRLRDAVRGVG